ncbi:MAG: ketol-acid reductoisomerase [Thermoprotei archaeon]
MVFGYGNQGRSQALNLRDSGFNVSVANIKDSYFDRATRDGFRPLPIKEGAGKADIALILLPDEVAPELYREQIEPTIKNGATLVFASGYNIFYGFIKPKKGLDVILAAPRMIGDGVRSLFLENKGFPVLCGIETDRSGSAKQTALALCRGLGAFRKGGCVLKSSFREEVLTDLMGEQALAGSMLFLTRAIFEIMVENGVSPEAALLELYLSGEYREVFERAAEHGLWEQLRYHSTTSQFGQQTRGPRLVSESARRELLKIMDEIKSGSFADDWEHDRSRGYPLFKKVWQQNLSHPMLKHEQRLLKRLRRSSERRA